MAGALLNPVLLGYPDEEVGPDSNIDYTVSKIGGLPVSLFSLKIHYIPN